MSFDFEAVFKDMAGAMKKSFVDDFGDIGDYWKEILENEKESLDLISNERLAGRWSQDKFEKELKREKEVMEIELLTIDIMTKAAAQKAINAAAVVFIKAVKMALPG